MTFDQYTVRPVEMSDAPLFFELVDRNKDRIRNFLPTTVRENSSPDFTSAYIHDKIGSAKAREHYCFVVIHTETKQLVGAIFLKRFDWTIPKCELGYFVDAASEGQGVTSGALGCILKHGFEEMGLNKFFLRAGIDNTGSCKVAEKNGFKKEGILRNDFKTAGGILIDVVYYGLLKGDFRAR
jgi:ribosomal-protein-serine acetyltransferase